MNCDCITVIEKKLAEKHAEALGATPEVSCEPVGFLLTGKTVIYTNFKVTADATGYRKGKSVPVHANYCPFCGTSVKDAA